MAKYWWLIPVGIGVVIMYYGVKIAKALNITGLPAPTQGWGQYYGMR